MRKDRSSYHRQLMAFYGVSSFQLLQKHIEWLNSSSPTNMLSSGKATAADLLLLLLCLGRCSSYSCCRTCLPECKYWAAHSMEVAVFGSLVGCCAWIRSQAKPIFPFCVVFSLHICTTQLTLEKLQRRLSIDMAQAEPKLTHEMSERSCW